MLKKILIIEAYTDANIGSAALVENSIALLRIKYPDSHILLMAHWPDAFRNLYGVDVVEDIFEYPYGRGKIFQYWWLFKTCIWMAMAYVLPLSISIKLFPSKLENFSWCDVAISIGAERINDKYIKGVIFSEFTYALVKKLGKKMIIFPSTFGPFLYKWTIKLFKYVFEKIDIIYTRDLESYHVTRELLDNSISRIINTCDVAIFQKWEDRSVILSTKYNKPIVGISAIKWIYKANKYETPYSNYNAYIREISLFVDSLIERYKVHVTLFPTNFPVHGSAHDDVKVSKDILNLVINKQDVDIMEDLVNPFEFKSRLSGSYINITTRMHACILSTSAYIPTISINYLFKLREYMQSLQLSEFSIDIEDFEHGIAMDTFIKLWNKRDKVSHHLKEIIAEKKSDIFKALDELDNIL